MRTKIDVPYCTPCRRSMDEVAAIEPFGREPGLNAYLCSKCGRTDSMLVIPHSRREVGSARGELCEGRAPIDRRMTLSAARVTKDNAMKRQGRAAAETACDFPRRTHTHVIDDGQRLIEHAVPRTGWLKRVATPVLKIELMLIKGLASAFLALAMLGCVCLIFTARIATYGLSLLKTGSWNRERWRNASRAVGGNPIGSHGASAPRSW